MTNDVKSSSSEQASTGNRTPDGRGWLAVGAIAAVSAALGGLAAAWYYRKTLHQLREAENEIQDPIPETTGDGMGEDF